jgi:Protein of unknown function (DUF3631)
MSAPTVPPVPTIDGDGLLTRVRDWLGTYISTASDSDLDLLALWAVHTHLVVETYYTPRLLIDSPVPESGKTTVLEHLQRLCKNSEPMATITSASMLSRMLDVQMSTFLIDEVDRALDPKKEGVGEMLAVLNTGYKRGGTRPVLEPGKGGKWVAKRMPTFAPVAMAGNSPRLPDDTRSRTIRMLLLPDRSGLIKESNWRKIESEAIALHDDIATWADQVRDQVDQHEPDLPDGIRGRSRERWAPLKAVADTAGGDWPKRVDAMAVKDKKELDMDKEDGLVRDKPSVALLHHIHEVWPSNQDRTANATFVPTADLITQLVIERPETYGPLSDKPLTAKRLGFLLADSYKIHSDQPVRGGPRGYHLASFVKPWTAMAVGQPASDDSDASDASDQGRGLGPASDQVDPLPQSDASDASDASDGNDGNDAPGPGNCGGDWNACIYPNCGLFQACIDPVTSEAGS